MGFSRGQQRHYRPLVKRAWIAHCKQTGTHPDADAPYEEWYRGGLMESINMDSTTGANQAEDFDLAMLYFATIAGDEYWIKRATSSAERRAKYVIKEKMKQLSSLTGEHVTWEYVTAIFEHMNLMADMDECPAELLWKVLYALDTHIRRVRQQINRCRKTKHDQQGLDFL